MGCDRTAEITGQQNCSENRGSRDYIQNSTCEQHDAERYDYRFAIAEIGRRFYNRFRLNQFHYTVKNQEQRRRAWVALAELALQRGDSEQAAQAWRQAASLPLTALP